ncbi:unnamed protein product [Rhizoctonia solani]|uniref:Uncharacterized protein n=1 Tax=Rhizoctonia solani TaxID=456999 RepID=A0A8H3HR05_9AGAM|nr:unnamed protein product [Rhizoctonia solani]
MDAFFNRIANDPNVRAARDAVANLPPPVRRVAKAGMIGVGTGIAVFATPPLLGFTASGVAAGSLAATIQSVVYGAAIPAGGWFATMQSVGATATIIPALIAGAGATGVAGAAQAAQGQGPEGNEGGEEGGAGEKETDEHDEAGDQEKRGEGEEQEHTKDGKEYPEHPSGETQIIAGGSSSHGEGSLQVASPDEVQHPMGHLPSPGQGREVFRPNNNQS